MESSATMVSDSNKFTRITNEALIRLGTEKHAEYISGEPYPHIVFNDFFNEEILNEVLQQAPSLAKGRGDIHQYDNRNEKKLASKGESQFGPTTLEFMHFLNSEPFLYFLENLTGIKNLIPDPHFEGGGHHEIVPGGFLKIHADFNKHGETGLDRRLNVLVYLNKDWEEAYGGHFELWDREMTQAVKKILPLFNRMAIFSTTSFTYHGHPDPLRCPEGRSRKSLALYYYTNGRPEEELHQDGEFHSTLFQARPNSSDDSLVARSKDRIKQGIKAITPPILIDAANWVTGRR